MLTAFIDRMHQTVLETINTGGSWRIDGHRRVKIVSKTGETVVDATMNEQAGRYVLGLVRVPGPRSRASSHASNTAAAENLTKVGHETAVQTEPPSSQAR